MIRKLLISIRLKIDKERQKLQQNSGNFGIKPKLIELDEQNNRQRVASRRDFRGEGQHRSKCTFKTLSYDGEAAENPRRCRVEEISMTAIPVIRANGLSGSVGSIPDRVVHYSSLMFSYHLNERGIKSGLTSVMHGIALLIERSSSRGSPVEVQKRDL